MPPEVDVASIIVELDWKSMSQPLLNAFWPPALFAGLLTSLAALGMDEWPSSLGSCAFWPSLLA